MLKWLVRIIVGLIAVVVLFVGGVFVAFSIWKSGQVRELEAGSEVIATALGDIEYADVGQGTPRLMIHGTPGGYDQTLVAHRVRPEAYPNVRFITVSRPGYLRTPVESGRTPAEQADLYAALLDELGIDQVVVYAGSGGAPSGLQFALRHPERTRALVLAVPLLERMESEEGAGRVSLTESLMSDMAVWAMGDRLLPMMLPDIDLDDPVQTASAKLIIASGVPLGLRTDGMENDMTQFRSLDVATWPLEELQVPTLFLHGNADENAPYEGSAAAAARIPNAELITYEGGNHFIVITRAAELSAEVEGFIEGLPD
ncbi:MAG: alpha/beta hydrolase [Maricaulaceae bacterium]|jgi:pimeloyl-ACP methyl ester carboxylesterase